MKSLHCQGEQQRQNTSPRHLCEAWVPERFVCKWQRRLILSSFCAILWTAPEWHMGWISPFTVLYLCTTTIWCESVREKPCTYIGANEDVTVLGESRRYQTASLTVGDDYKRKTLPYSVAEEKGVGGEGWAVRSAKWERGLQASGLLAATVVWTQKHFRQRFPVHHHTISSVDPRVIVMLLRISLLSQFISRKNRKGVAV